MEKRIEQLEKGFSGLSQELKEIKDLLSSSFTKVDANFTAIKRELDTIHLKVDLLKAETSGGLEDVGLKIENLTDEIIKINRVTNYEDLSRNLDTLN